MFPYQFSLYFKPIFFVWVGWRWVLSVQYYCYVVSKRKTRQFDTILTKKQKEHPQQRDDASATDADPGRVGRDELGEARQRTETWTSARVMSTTTQNLV